MTDLRCPTCDRLVKAPEDETDDEDGCYRLARPVIPREFAGKPAMVTSIYDCDGHVVNWRDRAVRVEAQRNILAGWLGMSPATAACIATTPTELTPEEQEHGERLVETLGDITSGLVTIDGPVLPCGHPRGCLCWYAGEAGEPDEESCGWCHDAEALRVRSAVLAGVQAEVDRPKGVEAQAATLRAVLVRYAAFDTYADAEADLEPEGREWSTICLCCGASEHDADCAIGNALSCDAGLALLAEVERLKARRAESCSACLGYASTLDDCPVCDGRGGVWVEGSSE